MSNNWISQLQHAELSITELALPGTHDSAAFTLWSGLPGIPGTWAQRKSITGQLDAGIRALDLRVGWASNNWTLGITSFVGMYHGPIYLSVTLEDLLNEVNRWLAANQQEFVILIFQQQGKPGQRDVADAVKELVTTVFAERLYPFTAAKGAWPTVGELRGMVFPMGRMRTDVDVFYNVREWLTQGNNTKHAEITVSNTGLRVDLQDNFEGKGKFTFSRSTVASGPKLQQSAEQLTDDTRAKFVEVKKAAARWKNPNSNVLKINHMSYSNLNFQPWQTGQKMNELLRESDLRIKGVVMIDDADDATVNHIIEFNQGL